MREGIETMHHIVDTFTNPLNIASTETNPGVNVIHSGISIYFTHFTFEELL